MLNRASLDVADLAQRRRRFLAHLPGIESCKA
jgi:hypothetical protein